jgi:hypothetical protein
MPDYPCSDVHSAVAPKGTHSLVATVHAPPGPSSPDVAEPHRRPTARQQDEHRLINVNAGIRNDGLDCLSVQSSSRRPFGLVPSPRVEASFRAARNPLCDL